MLELHYKRLDLTENFGKLYFGPLPSEKMLQGLKSEGVNVIWNLMAELPEICEMEVKMFPIVINTPIIDYSIPDDQFLDDLESIASLLERGENVYVHCFGGHGRTGTALASLARKLLKMPAEEALEFAHHWCGGPENCKQIQYVKELKI